MNEKQQFNERFNSDDKLQIILLDRKDKDRFYIDRIVEKVLNLQKNIDLKNNSQSNFTESLSRNKKMDSKEIKENEIINKLASKNLEAKYEQKINNTDFTFDSESQSFISRIKNENNLVLAQYPTEDMIRLKIYMNSQEAE